MERRVTLSTGDAGQEGCGGSGELVFQPSGETPTASSEEGRLSA